VLTGAAATGAGAAGAAGADCAGAFAVNSAVTMDISLISRMMQIRPTKTVPIPIATTKPLLTAAFAIAGIMNSHPYYNILYLKIRMNELIDTRVGMIT
jgi:hypothetical protein